MFKRLEKRWEDRLEGRVEGCASLELLGLSPQQVWAFVHPPESAVLLHEEVVRAFTVPGTGPGVGEQQCFVSRNRRGQESTSFLEVTALTEGLSAEYRSTPSPVPTGGSTSVEATAGGTRLTMTTWCLAPRIDPGSKEAGRREIESNLQWTLARIAAVLHALYLSPAADGLIQPTP